jgi:hypothetical protein
LCSDGADAVSGASPPPVGSVSGRPGRTIMVRVLLILKRWVLVLHHGVFHPAQVRIRPDRKVFVKSGSQL